MVRALGEAWRAQHTCDVFACWQGAPPRLYMCPLSVSEGGVEVRVRGAAHLRTRGWRRLFPTL